MPHVIAARYQLDREIGRGGMGAVWLGHDTLLDRRVALKQVGLLPGSDRADVERVRREARVSAMLNHPNVVAVFDLVAEEHRHWLVMEYVESETLADLIRRKGSLKPDRLAPILAQTAAALSAAHEAGIVHRDVKPSNILIGRDGAVKLGDFGIARTSADPTLTQTGMVTGSPGYMAPEVAAGKAARPASDIWALGATAFHALTGKPPYDTSENLMGALYRLVHEEPPRTSRAGWLEPLLLASMHRDPRGRWTARQAAAFLEHGPQEAGSTSVLPGLPRRGAATQPTAVVTTVAPIPPAPDRPRPGQPGQPEPPGQKEQSGQPGPLAPLVTAPAAVGAAAVGAARGLGKALGAGRDTPAPLAEEPTQVLGVPSRRWPALVAALVLIAAVVTGIVLLQGDPEGTSPPAGANRTTSAPVTDPEDRPTAEGMEAFVSDYLTTVARDPALAWTRLSRNFQVASGGYDSYLGWWSGLDKATVRSISADPDDLTVTYDVRYDWVKGQGKGKLRRDSTTLELTYTDGAYLIDYESD